MRGRKASQIEGIERYDFDKLASIEGNARERRRFVAFAHIREGKTFTESARAVRLKPRTLMNWVKRFKMEGLERCFRVGENKIWGQSIFKDSV